MASNQEEIEREYLIEKVELKGGSSAFKPAKRGGSTLTQVNESVALYGSSSADNDTLMVVRRWEALCTSLEERIEKAQAMEMFTALI